ncbi:tetratricopeptide repeat protein [Thalassoporum mexicanum]|uniref:tetratricopeptide repeat protein n=1 Tax=Thalassoporum mexicanum TaxID=3457544 RepID=UPI00059F00B3|nr:tetratricopeptide repeat protein [Pseudanabaena sp. PCC 7367]
MTQKRSAKRWIINGVLIIVTMSFLGISLAPMIGAIFTPSHDQANQNSPEATTREETTRKQIEGYEAVLEREPKNQTALRGLVELRSQLGDFEGAIGPLQTLAEINPDEPGYRLILARTYMQIDKRDAAVNEYRTILTTKPGNVEALSNLVELELEDERPEAAIGVLKDTLTTAETANKIEPGTVDTATVLWILGELYRTQGRYEEALTSYDKIDTIDDQDFRPLVGRAQIQRSLGNENEAQTLFADAAAKAPAQLKDRINQLASAPSSITEGTENNTESAESNDSSESTESASESASESTSPETTNGEQ